MGELHKAIEAVKWLRERHFIFVFLGLVLANILASHAATLILLAPDVISAGAFGESWNYMAAHGIIWAAAMPRALIGSRKIVEWIMPWYMR
jgi:hypothetical protein